MDMPEGMSAKFDQMLAGVGDIEPKVFLALFDAVDGICDAVMEASGTTAAEASGMILGLTHEALVARRVKDAKI